MFSKILIANRGEIALRVIRACKEMGIKTVAVYSEADADSLHVKFANEAVCIGKAPANMSYLNIPNIISAAEVTDVEAIHPGYGFLAEDAHFAEICESCDIRFIGPTPENMRMMGDKMVAKKTAEEIGVPVIPGSKDVIKTQEDALKEAKRIKYPVIIKASAGGGGKGMRVCHNDVRLVGAFLTARSEAEAAFGNPEVYMEKYIEAPRHVEIQILADSKGNVVHLGERDCTVQRRHQKLIEESPSVAISDKMRQKMCEAAVKVAKTVNYRGAGTIEFLVSGEDFYFMEMNTRIQVEHPVTELVTGIDIVKEQIKIAAGHKLSFAQEDIKNEGCAIECRINAEDPNNNFCPSPGKISALYVPGGLGVRVDTHVYVGYSIPPYYDSMIAKLITHGKTRKDAIKTMLRALDEFVVEPIKTTTEFHRRVLNDTDFQNGDISTHFVEKFFPKVEA
ncbi:MAG TPA: acetyl-CoA carboxylase biotin carboxylase subunit [Candidatus Omnitrophota bacterium]|nr:acetyl-CoA carboxylase biotin carboxylase subunit [Candidatus Omnitrophota bacterium]